MRDLELENTGIPVKSHVPYQHLPPMALDLRVAFYLFVASIAADNFDIIARLSIPHLFGFVLLIIITVRGKWFLKMPDKTFWFFVAYVAIFAMSVKWINPFFFAYWQKRMLQLTEYLLFFWVCSILLSYRQIIENALYAFSYSLITMVLLARLKVPGFASEKAVEYYADRATVGTADPNGFTLFMGIAFLFLLDRLMSYHYKTGKIHKWLTIVLIYMMTEIIQAGSRGGQLAIVGGLLALMITNQYKMKRRSVIAILVVAFLSFTLMSFFSENMSQRWKETLNEGSMSRREDIYPLCVEMIKNKPVLGYGPGEHLYVLGGMMGYDERDPHNSFFWVIHEVGFVGGIPYMIGFILCGVLAFKKRKKPFGSIAFALWILIMIGSLDLSLIYRKSTWFILSLAASDEW